MTVYLPGLEPDYDSHIPQAKMFNPEELVTKLNEEGFPWDGTEFGIRQTRDWNWVKGAASPDSGVFQLTKKGIIIGALKLSDGEGNYFMDFDPYGLATVEDVRFIRECTGWKINV